MTERLGNFSGDERSDVSCPECGAPSAEQERGEVSQCVGQLALDLFPKESSQDYSYLTASPAARLLMSHSTRPGKIEETEVGDDTDLKEYEFEEGDVIIPASGWGRIVTVIAPLKPPRLLREARDEARKRFKEELEERKKYSP